MHIILLGFFKFRFIDLILSRVISIFTCYTKQPVICQGLPALFSSLSRLFVLKDETENGILVCVKKALKNIPSEIYTDFIK